MDQCQSVTMCVYFCDTTWKINIWKLDIFSKLVFIIYFTLLCISKPDLEKQKDTFFGGKKSYFYMKKVYELSKRRHFLPELMIQCCNFDYYNQRISIQQYHNSIFVEFILKLVDFFINCLLVFFYQLETGRA